MLTWSTAGYFSVGGFMAAKFPVKSHCRYSYQMHEGEVKCRVTVGQPGITIIGAVGKPGKV
eukprot:1147387-Pelagomonas_calceolata.AAC.4